MFEQHQHFLVKQNKDEMTLMIHSDRSLAMMDNYVSRVYYADYTNCSTVDIPTPYFSSQFAMPVQKGLPYLEAFSYHIKAIRVGTSCTCYVLLT